MTQETVVLFANEAFYVNFTNHDADSMDAIWSARDDVTCIHPGWQPLRGRNAVMKSWRQILKNSETPKIRCEHAHAYIDGTMAYVLCTEILTEGQLAATNIFVLEDGVWKMVHHQASPMRSVTPEPAKNIPTLQ